MAKSILVERARLAGPLVRQGGKSHFPFTHPDYPHQDWLTEEKAAACETATDAVEDPFTTGEAGGTRLWETAASPTMWTEFRTMSAQRTPAFRKTNLEWTDSTVPSFYRVGTVENGEKVRRPENEAIVDLMSESWGWRLLEAAHALAHRAEVQQRFRPMGYGLYGSRTINIVAKLAAGLRYGLPVDVSGEPAPTSPGDAARSNDGFYRYGISLCDSNCFHAPFLRVPCLGRDAPVPDRDICFVACGVYVEPHPKGFTDGTGKWMEVNRWSCSPTMVSFAGWELADVVLRQQPSAIVNGWSKPEYVIAAPALMPENRLCEYIDAAMRARGAAQPDFRRFWPVKEWLASRACAALIATSPPFPCKDCMRINMRAEGAPGKPMCRPPQDKPDPKSKYLTKEEREWLEWDARIDSVYDMVEKATVYYEARLFGATEAKRIRVARKRAARERSEALRKIESLTKRARCAYRSGSPSKAEALMREVSNLQATVRSDTIQGHEEKVENAETQEA